MVNRYSFKYVAGNHLAGCHICQDKAVAICTDKVTGDEYWTCEKHSYNTGKCQRRQLHQDFTRQKQVQEKIDLNLHINSQENHSQDVSRPKVEQNTLVSSGVAPIFKTALQIEQEGKR